MSDPTAHPAPHGDKDGPEPIPAETANPTQPTEPIDTENTATSTAPAAWDTPTPEPSGVPLGTLVFGLVVVALGLLILVSVFYDITLSGSAVAIALFLGAGLVLIIGGIIAARRSAGTGGSGS